MLMFVELLVTGRDVGCFNAELCLRARSYIKMSLLRGYTDKVTTKKKYLALQSIEDPSGWLTDGVLNSYFAGL